MIDEGQPQFLKLRKQPNHIDPVEALHKLLVLQRKSNEPVFRENNGSPFSRTSFDRLYGKFRRGDLEGCSGHSFRIGGASLLFNFGATVEELKAAGRWDSDVYILYCRTYSREQMLSAKACARAIWQ